MDRMAKFHAALSLPDPVHATISVGVATWPADGEEAGTLLAAADERLYAAKSAGRACIKLPPRGREVVGNA